MTLSGKKLLISAVLSMVLCLAGCKVDVGTDNRGDATGGGFLGTTNAGQGIDADGIWLGNTPENTDFNINLLVRQGNLVMIGRGLAYVGTYDPTVTGSNFAASINVYNSNGLKLTNTPITVNGSRINDTTLTLAVDAIIFNGATIANPQTMNFNLQGDIWNRASSYELISDLWTLDIPAQSYHLEFPILPTGVLNDGAIDSDGCVYSGALQLLDTTKNLYSANLTLTGAGCATLEGDRYSGYASLLPDDNSLLIVVANGTHAFSLELTRQQ